MKGLKEIREKLGLTQTQMAKYLGISRSVLGMSETAQRSMKTQAMVKASKLAIVLERHKQISEEVEQVFQSNIQKAEEKLSDQIVDLELINNKLNKKLSAMLEKEAQAKLILSLLPSIISVDVKPKDRALFELLGVEAHQIINENTLFNRLTLAYEIKTIQFKLDHLRKM